MLRREALRGSATAGTIAVVDCVSGSDSPPFQKGFEDGIGDWAGAATHYVDDVPVELEER